MNIYLLQRPNTQLTNWITVWSNPVFSKNVLELFTVSLKKYLFSQPEVFHENDYYSSFSLALL